MQRLRAMEAELAAHRDEGARTRRVRAAADAALKEVNTKCTMPVEHSAMPALTSVPKSGTDAALKEVTHTNKTLQQYDFDVMLR